MGADYCKPTPNVFLTYKQDDYLAVVLPEVLSEFFTPEPVVGIEVEPELLEPAGTPVLEVGAVPLGLFIDELPVLLAPPLEEVVPDEVVPDGLLAPDELLPIELLGLFIEPHALRANAHARGRIHFFIKSS